MAARWPAGRLAYIGIAVLLLVCYSATAALAWSARGWDDRGPLNLHAPPLTAPLPGAIDLNQVLDRTFPERTKSDEFRIVGAVVDGRPYYAVYDVDKDLYV